MLPVTQVYWLRKMSNQRRKRSTRGNIIRSNLMCRQSLTRSEKAYTLLQAKALTRKISIRLLLSLNFRTHKSMSSSRKNYISWTSSMLSWSSITRMSTVKVSTTPMEVHSQVKTHQILSHTASPRRPSGEPLSPRSLLLSRPQSTRRSWRNKLRIMSLKLSLLKVIRNTSTIKSIRPLQPITFGNSSQSSIRLLQSKLRKVTRSTSICS